MGVDPKRRRAETSYREGVEVWSGSGPTPGRPGGCLSPDLHESGYRTLAAVCAAPISTLDRHGLPRVDADADRSGSDGSQ